MRSRRDRRSLASGVRSIAPSMPENALVGRTRELVEVSHLLAGRRLVTITGAGGCGKTRLADELISAADTLFHGGGYWVDLTSSSDGESAARHLADALEI